MATEFVISFRDRRPIGSIAEIQSLLRAHFPDIKFRHTTSRLEKLRIAKERKLKLPPRGADPGGHMDLQHR